MQTRFHPGAAALVAAAAVISALAFHVATPSALHAQTTPADSGKTLNLAAGGYTDAQASRGEALFRSTCAECHTRSDMSNPDFRFVWSGRPLLDLYDRIRTTMPEDNPGSLSRTEYAEIVAYLLKLNGLPVGGYPLPADSATLRHAKLDIPIDAKR